MNFFPILNKISSYYNAKQIEQVFTKIYNAVAGIAINYKKNSYKPDKINNYLDMMLKAIDDKEISLGDAVMDVVLFFGTGTVASALTMHMGVLYAAQNIDIQNQIFEELSKIKNNKFLTIDAISKCPLFNAFVYETLRMTCPVTVPFAHKCTESTTVTDPNNPNTSYTIPKDSLVLANMYYVHRESKEDWGENCHQFDIKRWLQYDNNRNASLNDRHKNLLVFSHGGRSCVGKYVAHKEIQLVLANLFLNYQFSFDRPNSVNFDDMRTFNGFYWKLKDPIGVKVNKRQ